MSRKELQNRHMQESLFCLVNEICCIRNTEEKTPDSFGHLRNEKHRCSPPEWKFMCNIFQSVLTTLKIKPTSDSDLLLRCLLLFAVQETFSMYGDT